MADDDGFEYTYDEESGADDEGGGGAAACPPPSHSRAQGPRSAREREKVPIRVAAVADMRGYDVLDGGPPRARARRAARTPAMCVSHGMTRHRVAYTQVPRRAPACSPRSVA